MRLTKMLGLCLLVTLWAAGCEDDEDDEEPIVGEDAGPTPGDAGMMPGDAGEQMVVTVQMRNNRFDPETIDVRVGQTIRWTNMDGEAHTATSGASSMPADMPGQLFDLTAQPGQSVEHTVTQAGTIPYFCRFHEALGMEGTINASP